MLQCQVFEDQQQGLHLTFAQQHALQAVERAPTPLGRVECAKWIVLRQDIQQGKQGRESVLEGGVGRRRLSGRLRPAGTRVVALLDLDVAFQQVDHREVGRGLAMDAEALSSTSQPWRRCERSASSTRRDLPTPASPTCCYRLPVARPPPVPGPGASASSSVCRPTKRVSPRTTAAWNRPRKAVAPGSSKTSRAPPSL